MSEIILKKSEIFVYLWEAFWALLGEKSQKSLMISAIFSSLGEKRRNLVRIEDDICLLYSEGLKISPDFVLR